MAIVSGVEIPVDTKDPREAVGKWIELIESQTVGLGNLKIGVALISRANRGVLDQLAEHLPTSAIGFTGFGKSDRAKTVLEFRADPTSEMWSYSGEITDNLKPLDAIGVVKKLISCAPQAIRSTSFTLDASGFRWKGSPAESTAGLHLFDFKNFNRKKRFSLTAIISAPGKALKSKEAKAFLKQAFANTGIPFDKGRLSVTADKIPEPAVRAKAILVGQVCFDEAVSVAAAAICAQSGVQMSRAALSRSEASALRLKEWGSGEAVSLAAVVKRIIKSDLPELIFESGDAEEIWFKKPLSVTAELVVAFCKSLPRIGKAFSIKLGVRPAAPEFGGLRFTAALFELERVARERSWIYSTNGEAEASVRVAVEILKDFLKVFEPALRTHFDPWPSEIPANFRRHENLTARRAVELAWPLVRDELPDAQLIRLTNSTRSLAVRDLEGSEISIDGRARDNGKWWLHFYSKSTDRSIEVQVPALGSIQIGDHGDTYKENSRYILEAINERWIDSSEAFAIAETNGGETQRLAGKMFGISANLHAWKWHKPVWEIMYLLTDERGRNDFTAVIDAETGKFTPGGK